VAVYYTTRRTSACVLHLCRTPRDLHSCPTRRSSDLSSNHVIWSRVPRQNPSSGTAGEDCNHPPDGVAEIMFPHRSTTSTWQVSRSEEHTSELQSRENLVCRLLLEKKNKITLSSTLAT